MVHLPLSVSSPPECIILWVFLELLQLFMSVFALSHSCSSFTSPSSPLSSCFLSLFAASDSHLSRWKQTGFSLFCFFFMPCCFSVCKTRKHTGTHSHTSTTPTMGECSWHTYKSTRAVLCGMTQVSLRVETLLVKVRQAGAQTHRLNSCLYTHTSPNPYEATPHKQLLYD